MKYQKYIIIILALSLIATLSLYWKEQKDINDKFSLTYKLDYHSGFHNLILSYLRLDKLLDVYMNTENIEEFNKQMFEVAVNNEFAVMDSIEFNMRSLLISRYDLKNPLTDNIRSGFFITPLIRDAIKNEKNVGSVRRLLSNYRKELNSRIDGDVFLHEENQLSINNALNKIKAELEALINNV